MSKRLISSALCLLPLFARIVRAEPAMDLSVNAASFNPSFPYGSEKVRGVNLGGWLVLEPWITPSLFDDTGNDAIVDEWTFCQYQSNSVAKSKLQSHWDSWITEQDFSDIAAAGLNHVRLPIGYWAWDVQGDEPYVQGQLPYLRKAIGWAKNHNLKVIIDLHGAPGSQNGYDNSGHRLTDTTGPTWQTSQNNVDRTNAVLKKIAAEFGSQSETAPIIAPLNEPAGYYSTQLLDTTKQYWKDSYGNIREQSSNTVELIHDAFMNVSYWADFMPKPAFQGVAIDTHIYQVFSDAENARSQQQHIDNACQNGPKLADFNNNQLWTIVGEWTPAMTDCAKYLNGRGVGARYDGSFEGSAGVGSCKDRTGSISDLSSSYKTFLRKMFEAQTSAFEQGSGWVMWTWKAEDAADWTYQDGLDGGWIPQDPTDRKYPNICG
ncbi:unnamed protein product [Peniophora sp. CBMAI 1063]|nr:unnamed protein product [Peniophora sp. CBMAI 1063]